MMFPNREAVERVRREFPVGCRIVLDSMADPYVNIPEGTQATVLGVDDAGSVMPAWDCGSTLNIVFGEDRCHKIGAEEEAKITLPPLRLTAAGLQLFLTFDSYASFRNRDQAA